MKLISASLDYEVFHASGKPSLKPTRITYKFKIRLEQLYKTALNLFSLKTQPFRKSAIVSVPCISIILFFSLTGFQEYEELGPYSIAQLNLKYVDWFNAGQIDSIGLMYQENACFIPYNHVEIHGRKNIKKYYRALYNSGFRFYKNESKVLMVKDSITVERGIWLANNNINYTGTYLAHWKLSSNGRWHIENSMSNGDNIK
ncbi:YybH family protein [Adhaeribacter pallidiroseus]|uniref:YybH family protein n=1 Tax=Adhaeribacter pallidiroseus TaxID=2072847 RepID=UPI001F45E3DB|nr:hypothetical protein [Adhaeribacter pallidiroseus]